MKRTICLVIFALFMVVMVWGVALFAEYGVDISRETIRES